MTKEKEKPKWTKRKNVPEVTKNWHNYMVKKVVQDFQVTLAIKFSLFFN